ncbi:glycerophosphodiester phosphodiesterase [Maribius pontilimi]|uniref:glycerophosphodiester phosphodiesterase n=1 Tax=Palleronia pontilimi TaxID=1964209 RepID=A0A934IBF9_9RHOB|nr:glycerophosphodiester phosphodiesterase family protein [Palleronia pontilimi]MBJ3762561.1 glycerophosphodiester phosphodiesterase [Palleronia pontilimi]
MRYSIMLALAAGIPAAGHAQDTDASGPAMSYGQRPAYLVDKLPEGELKDTLGACLGQTPERTEFSIGHRGAPLMFPEHTVESNVAAARQGAGILECDVTFTEDKQLVCRHAQNDLHTTTDILTTDLASTCVTPFQPASGDADATAECRTSEITLDEFRTLTPKMDAADASATTAEAYLGGVAPFRTTLYSDGAQLMTHAESIELFRSLGAKFTPELKAPSVEMPFDGMSQEDYAQMMVDEYTAAGVPPEDVWPQSFNLDDVKYWIDNTDFGAQAVYLDDRYEAEDEDEGLIDPNDPATFKPTMQELADMGVQYIAPPLWMLLTLDEAGEMVPSAYADEAKAAGLNIITWTLERSGPLSGGGGWYYQSVADTIDNDSDYLTVLDALAQDVGVVGVFSDWPATVTFYANCMNL